jgi:plasmid replication initiation protein
MCLYKLCVAFKENQHRNASSISRHCVNHLVKATDIEYLRVAVKGLQTKPITINDEQNGNVIICNLISGARITTRTGKVQLAVSEFIMPYIVELKKHFSVLELQSIMKMRGTYSKRVYMMMCQFRSTGYFVITVADFRRRLNLTDKYPVFSDLEKRVISPAIDEINQCSEFVTRIRKDRTGTKAITTLEFDIALNATSEEVRGNDRQIDFMKRCGLADWQIYNICSTLTPEQIHPVLYQFNIIKNKIQNKGAYLAASFTNAGVVMDRKLPQQLSILNHAS